MVIFDYQRVFGDVKLGMENPLFYIMDANW